jgi:hypothetical protein
MGTLRLICLFLIGVTTAQAVPTAKLNARVNAQLSSSAVLRCEARAEKETVSSVHDVGSFTVQNCVAAGIELKKKVGSGQKVEIRYIHYTETGDKDLSRKSKGWFLFSKIEDEYTSPNQFEYAEFINP